MSVNDFLAVLLTLIGLLVLLYVIVMLGFIVVFWSIRLVIEYFGWVSCRRVIDLSPRGARSKEKVVRLFDTAVVRDGGILDSFIGPGASDFYKRAVVLYGECDSFAKGAKFAKENTELLVRLQADARLELGEFFAEEWKGLNLERLRTMSDDCFFKMLVGLVESDGTINFEEGYLRIKMKFSSFGLIFGVHNRLVSYCEGRSLAVGEVKYGCSWNRVEHGDKKQFEGELGVMRKFLIDGMSLEEAERLFLCGFFSQGMNVVGSDLNYLSGSCYVWVEGRSFDCLLEELESRKFLGLNKKGLDVLVDRGSVMDSITACVFEPERVMGLTSGDGSFGKIKKSGNFSLYDDLTLDCTRGFRLTGDFIYTLGAKCNEARGEEFLTALGDYLLKHGGTSYDLDASGVNLRLGVPLTPELIEFFKKRLIGLKRRELDILLGLKVFGGNSSCLDVFRDIEDSRMSNSPALKGKLVPKGFERITKNSIWGLLRELSAGRIALATRACPFRGLLLMIARARYNVQRDIDALAIKKRQERLEAVRVREFAKWKKENPLFIAKFVSKLGGGEKKG